MGRRRRLQAPARSAPRPAALRPARRAAVRQRPAARRPRREQDPEGHDRQGAPARRLRLALHPGLGLPRPADRERDREDLRPRPDARRGAGQEPRLRDRADRPADDRLPPGRRARRLGASVPDDGLRQRGRRDPRLQADDRARLRLSRPEAGVLVLRLRLVAGRVRDRVRRPQVDRDRRRLPRRRSGPARRRLRPAGDHEGRVRRHLDDDAVDDPGEPGAQPQPQARVLAGRHRARPAACWRARSSPSAWRATASRARSSPASSASASKGCSSVIRSPPSTPGYDRLAPVYLADYATAEDGTGIVHSAPAYGVDDFNSCRAHGLAVDDILNPVQGNGVYEDAPAAVRRLQHLEGDADGRRRAARRRPPARELDAGAQLSALLAPQDTGRLPRGGAVVRSHGRGRRVDARRVRHRPGAADAARVRARRDRRDRVLSRERPRPPARHDRAPPRLVHQPAAQLGRAAAVLPAQGERRAPSRHARPDRPRRGDRRAGRGRGLVGAQRRRRPRQHRSAFGRALRQEQRHPRRLVRFGIDLLPRPARQPPGNDQPRRRRQEARGRPLSRRPRPAPRLVPLVAADRLRDRRPRALPRPADARLHRRRLGPEDEQEPGQLRRPERGHGQARRRDHPPLVRVDRLLGRPGDRRQDPGARRRRLPAHQEHAALPARQHERLRRRPRRVAGRRDARDRPLGARPHGGAAGRDRRQLRRVARRLRRRPLRRLRVPSGHVDAAGVLLRGPRRVLPRHPEGPALHDGAGLARAPLGADRALAHRPRDAALDGAVPQLHRRGGVAGVRAEGIAVDLRRDLRRRQALARRGAARALAPHRRGPRRVESPHRGAARRGHGSARRCRPR